MDPIRLIVVGAGSRGTGYATYARQHPEQVQIVGVAEPRDFYRERLADDYDIPFDNVCNDWCQLTERPKFADGVIIAVQDAEHADPAIAFANLGYHILLEKPMAPSSEDCRRIVEAAKRNDVIFAVCHVMRYTHYTQQLKAIIDSGRIGTIVSIAHLEPVGYWHQAHSFVRGNWRNEAQSSPMLLAKSCHDVDWLRYIMGQPCVQVSSFGSLKHFRPEERPDGATDRCLTCPVEPRCPYSAIKIYLGRVERGETGWPVNVLTPDVTVTGVTEALRTGPYGRCVYGCDNDVVDHQVVNMVFANGATASFTMTAFTKQRDRETRIFGTHGEIYGDGSTIEIYDFLTDQTEVITTDQSSDGSILTGHGGGDYALMQHFVAALASNDATQILSGPQESLETHLTVFAAETARREGRVVNVLV
ncbi:MAG: Gfo/Idh/MocA family oxidoreductase [Herpetosiphonaceae bacterium]|nr:Gfo/Idh/MocA family oxidoreductase [Herpetosiphonaceae bacterium]